MPRKLNYSQPFLFAIDSRQFAESIGLDWWAAKKLYDDKWLSFDPEKTQIDNEAMQAEFLFLGSLVAAGCDPHILKRLLADLEKPYSYDLSRMYYDWPSRQWKDLPHKKPPIEIAREIIAAFEDDNDTDSLIEIKTAVQEAIDRFAEGHESDDGADDAYDFDAEQDNIVSAVLVLLWKIAASPLVDKPEKIVVVGKLFKVFQRLPKVTRDEDIRLNLTGPLRKYGDHEIYHFWTIELNDEGVIRVSSAGHFYRPQTGGDSFTAMTWEVVPCSEPELSDYLYGLSIVDDADTFENEVDAMDLDSGGYELSVDDPSLEGWETNEVDESEEEPDVTDNAAEPFSAAEQALAALSDMKQAKMHGEHHPDPPESCDECGCQLDENHFFVDGRLRGELMWANMCPECFAEKGEGIGWGKGQLYMKQTNGDWLMTGGFAPGD
ncbi:MAG: hypothetical protein NT178_08360 [Proteobacteria bacterium]|nr:hypothetical protein [Pseudomonadota bacterium]